MTEEEIVATLNVGVLGLFTLLSVVGAASTVARAGRWARDNVPPPKLLIRDAILMVGLSFPFMAILTARVFQIPPEITRTVPWVVLTSGPALFGVGTYVYFEFFVIGQTQRHLSGRGKVVEHNHTVDDHGDVQHELTEE